MDRIIGVYAIANAAVLCVYRIEYNAEYGDDMVVVSLNNGEKEFCSITYDTKDEKVRAGFIWHNMTVYFDEILKV